MNAMRAVVLCTFLCSTLLTAIVQSMCPSGCVCTTDERHIVRCDNAPLMDIPSLLDPRTKTLTISNCSIGRLDPDVMELYPDLEFLDLSANQLERLDIDIFRYQTKLRVLRLHHNKLSHIQSDSLAGLIQLQSLDLSANALNGIEPTAMQHLQNLVELNLSNNLLGNLPFETLNGLSKLLKLDLSFNRLLRLDASFFEGIPSVESLNLQNNLISEINDATFSKLNSLLHLNLAENQISSLSDSSLKGLYALRFLNLSNNVLQFASSIDFHSLNSVEELDLSANNFTQLTASSFNGLTNLHTLHLSHSNNLRSIREYAFSNLLGLERLNLSHCPKLHQIDENAFESLRHLKSLDLSLCAIHHLSPILIDWSRLQMLDLSGNPWHCDCEQLSFLPEVARFLNLTDLACATPEEHALKLIVELPSSCSSLSGIHIVLVILAGAVAIISILSFALFYHRNRLHFDCCTRNDNHSSAPLYARSLLISSTNACDKSDLLSNTTFYSSSTNQNNSSTNSSNRSSPPAYTASRNVNADVDNGNGNQIGDDYYSSMLLPNAHSSQPYPVATNYCYSEPQSDQEHQQYCPIPPSTSTIPGPPNLPTEDEDYASGSNCNFKIISEYPIPITEL